MRDEQEMKELLDGLVVPEASADFEARIIVAAHSAQPAQVIAFKPRPARNWNILGPKLALAASLAAAAVFIFDPAGKATEYYTAQREYERYTVHGTPLLDDLQLVSEPTIELDMAYVDTRS